MIFSTDNTVDENMVYYGEDGECTNGLYAHEVYTHTLQSCVQQCLGEVECLYATFMVELYPFSSKKYPRCKRFKNRSCGFKSDDSIDTSTYLTYQKVPKGAFDDFIQMCLNLLNNFLSLIKLILVYMCLFKTRLELQSIHESQLRLRV